jgi:deoxyribose-phosphate aldolase
LLTRPELVAVEVPSGGKVMQEIDSKRIAGLIDHTFLKPDGGPEFIERLCQEACEYAFATVMVNPSEVSRCVSLLRGSGVGVGTVIGFPLGQNTARTKIFEATECLELGASELDMVLNQRALKRGDLKFVEDELRRFAELCRTHGVISKVILECCNLNDEEKVTVCQIASNVGCSFVKTSTGFGSGGATVHDVKLLSSNVAAGVGVKASGGIRSLQDAMTMIAAGATRLGTSAGVAIVKELVTGTDSLDRAAKEGY